MEYRVKALITFNDAKDKILREEGDEFSCDKERFEQLVTRKLLNYFMLLKMQKS